VQPAGVPQHFPTISTLSSPDGPTQGAAKSMLNLLEEMTKHIKYKIKLTGIEFRHLKQYIESLQKIQGFFDVFLTNFFKAVNIQNIPRGKKLNELLPNEVIQKVGEALVQFISSTEGIRNFVILLRGGVNSGTHVEGEGYFKMNDNVQHIRFPLKKEGDNPEYWEKNIRNSVANYKVEEVDKFIREQGQVPGKTHVSPYKLIINDQNPDFQDVTDMITRIGNLAKFKAAHPVRLDKAKAYQQMQLFIKLLVFVDHMAEDILVVVNRFKGQWTTILEESGDLDTSVESDVIRAQNAIAVAADQIKANYGEYLITDTAINYSREGMNPKPVLPPDTTQSTGHVMVMG